MGFDVGFFGAVVAGLLSFLSPCVLPIVPASLSFIAGVSFEELSDTDRDGAISWRVVWATIAFVLGFATIFVALGASASFIGELLTEHSGKLAKVAGIVIIILGLHFAGVFRIGLLYRDTRFDVAKKPAGLIGAYVVGLAFGFGWTPCVGPVLSSILLVAGSRDSMAEGAMLLGGYAAGIGIPFILAAVFIGGFFRWFKNFRKHLGLMEKITGGLLIITGILIFTGKMAEIANWLLLYVPAFG